MKSSSSNGSVFVWDGAYSNNTTSSTSVMDEKNGDFDEVCVCVTTSSDRSHLLNHKQNNRNSQSERWTYDKDAISNKRWNKLPEVLEIRIGFNIATEMVAGFFWTNHRTEKGKNQCNFGPLYTPFVKLSTPFYREEYHPRKHHFCLFKQKTWRVNQEAGGLAGKK